MYYHERQTGKTFEEAEADVREELKERGFGVLTEIDAKKTLKEKLGIDTEPYVILGACNPKFAHKAMEAEPNIGVLLPCNVLVRESGGKRYVVAILPKQQMEAIGNPDLTPIAEEVERLLKEAVDAAA